MQVLVNEDARRVVDGVEYHAQSVDNNSDSCTGCSFTPGTRVCIAAPCVPTLRADRSYVIWVKAE